MTRHRIFAYVALVVALSSCKAPSLKNESASASATPEEESDPRPAPHLDDAPLLPDGGATSSDAAAGTDSSLDGGLVHLDGGAADAAESLRDVHRAYNAEIGDHLQGLVANEGAPAWRYEGVGFRLHADGNAERAALYRCRVNGAIYHFLSNQEDCEGHVMEGLLGYLSTAEGEGLPLYRCVLGTDHLSTLDPSECQVAGFAVEGRQGFAFR
jgi:hypothetical protein